MGKNSGRGNVIQREETVKGKLPGDILKTKKSFFQWKMMLIFKDIEVSMSRASNCKNSQQSKRSIQYEGNIKCMLHNSSSFMQDPVAGFISGCHRQ